MPCGPTALNPVEAGVPEGQEELVPDVQEEEQLETAKPVLRKPPSSPSLAERREHDDTGHVVSRSWCKICNETRTQAFSIVHFPDRRRKKPRRFPWLALTIVS